MCVECERAKKANLERNRTGIGTGRRGLESSPGEK
jgi:hypothetical protein